jgi:hypothetical protein
MYVCVCEHVLHCMRVCELAGRECVCACIAWGGCGRSVIVCMYVCVCVYVYIYIYTCMHACKHTSHTCTHTYTYRARNRHTANRCAPRLIITAPLRVKCPNHSIPTRMPQQRRLQAKQRNVNRYSYGSYGSSYGNGYVHEPAHRPARHVLQTQFIRAKFTNGRFAAV